MRRYRNKKTGAVIEVYGQVTGQNWEPLYEAPYSVPDTLVDPYADVFGIDVDKPQPAKPKTTRRRKANDTVCNH